MDKNYKNYFDVNRDTWNKKVMIHKDSDFYDVKGFLNGKSSLNNYELVGLGDVSGKKLLHLQCHFGLDTLSWARLGAKCTGIDLSEEGIAEAKKLNSQLHLDARFITSNVYDVPSTVLGQFDIVFTSYGVVGWLPDLTRWAEIIAEKLNKGGVFYMVEFHPIIWMFDYLVDPVEMKYPYHNGGVIYEEYKGTYADDSAAIVSKEYGWNHGLGEVVSALTKAGLTIDFLKEYDESPYDCLPGMKQLENDMYVIKNFDKIFPLLYAVRARKA